MRRFCLALVALFALAAPAAAGGCCGYWAAAPEIQPVVPVSTYRFDAPPPVSQVYVVNQGPVLSGPGIYAYTNHYVPSFVPAGYPYVSGCGGYGGCGETYGSGCCGHSYSYSYGCGGYGGCSRGLWSSATTNYEWNGRSTGYYGYRHYRAYRGYRHHAAPLAGTVAPSRGY
jgi:hypothetical protein